MFGSVKIAHMVFVSLFFQPLPAGQKRKKESWENVWYIGMYGTMGVAAVLLYYKPDTRCVFFPCVLRIHTQQSLYFQHTIVGPTGGQVSHGGTRREDSGLDRSYTPRIQANRFVLYARITRKLEMAVVDVKIQSLKVL